MLTLIGKGLFAFEGGNEIEKIFSKKQLGSLNSYDKSIVGVIEEVINILDENYSENRNIDLDIGGYVLILENKSDIEEVKNGLLEGLESEYTDTIQNYTSNLYIISSDVAVVDSYSIHVKLEKMEKNFVRVVLNKKTKIGRNKNMGIFDSIKTGVGRLNDMKERKEEQFVRDLRKNSDANIIHNMNNSDNEWTRDRCRN